VLDRWIGPGFATARRRVRRGSRTWRLLARTWAAWRALERVVRRTPWIRRRWARAQAEFDRHLEHLSATTPDFFVVQIGACDGLMADPIHAWIKRYRWHGILVEPQRNEFERLQVTYRDDRDRLVFENVAIAESNGTRSLYRVRDSAQSADWERGIATLLPQREDAGRFAAEIVPCITFDTLLDRHRVAHIDLLQIDVEGYDFEVLKLLDFDRIQPAVIRYEHRHLGPADRHACRVFLARRGYRILGMEFDTGAVRTDAAGRPLSRVPNPPALAPRRPPGAANRTES
jgi:FkbM family methyltransferase